MNNPVIVGIRDSHDITGVKQSGAKVVLCLAPKGRRDGGNLVFAFAEMSGETAEASQHSPPRQGKGLVVAEIYLLCVGEDNHNKDYIAQMSSDCKPHIDFL